MTTPKPVALAYLGGRTQQHRCRQHALVAEYAREEGYTLADDLIDVRDRTTISELATSALLQGASAVIVPSGTRMAGVRVRLTQELEPHGIKCLVIDAPNATTSVATTRLARALPRGRSGADIGRNIMNHTQAHLQGEVSQWLVGLDIDGTITTEGSVHVPVRTRNAVAAVRAAGGDVALASGRSLAGILPVAAALGLTEAWVVASNGAVTARLTPGMPGGYEVVTADMLEAGPVIGLALQHLPGVWIAVEDVGTGYWVSTRFPAGTINGRQTQRPITGLMNTDTPRLILRAPGVVDVLLERVRDLGVTAHAGTDSIDVTPPLSSKGTALELVRERLGVARSRVVAVGDGANDLDMFGWARGGGGRAVAMGHASEAVQEAAGEVTGDLADEGVVAVLYSLLGAERGVLEVVR
ncbi:hypothetical protein GCM10028784_29660 [Myceligenerans cantabricum]